MQVFDDASRSRFLGRLESAIRGRHPDLVEVRTLEELRADLAVAVSAAKRHRIDYESHVYQFTVMFLTLGSDFEDRSDAGWALEILKSDLPAETRLFQLRETYLIRQGAPPA